MASRKNVLRLVLVAGLAVLLSGCYARYSAPYGASYAYQGAYRHAPSGHAYDKDSHREPGRHHWAAARERDHRSEPTRRDRHGSADRKTEPQPALAEDYGRGAEWRPGPTARDEGPRPGAEGGAR